MHPGWGLSAGSDAHDDPQDGPRYDGAMDAGAKLQALYDAEVNFAIETFWDAGFKAKLGDPMNGWRTEGEFRSLDEAADWLLREAALEFPPAQVSSTSILELPRRADSSSAAMQAVASRE